MKCRIKGWNDLSPKVRNDTINSITEMNKQLVEKELERMKVVITNNLFKLFVVSSNEQCGLGKERIAKILKGVNEMVINMTDDNDTFFMFVEETCKRILGQATYNLYFKDIPFKMLPKNYNFINQKKQEKGSTY